MSFVGVATLAACASGNFDSPAAPFWLFHENLDYQLHVGFDDEGPSAVTEITYTSKIHEFGLDRDGQPSIFPLESSKGVIPIADLPAIIDLPDLPHLSFTPQDGALVAERLTARVYFANGIEYADDIWRHYIVEDGAFVPLDAGEYSAIVYDIEMAAMND